MSILDCIGKRGGIAAVISSVVVLSITRADTRLEKLWFLEKSFQAFRILGFKGF